MTTDKLIELFGKCQSQTATAAEKAVLLSMLEDAGNEEAIRNLIDGQLAEEKPLQDISDSTFNAMLEAIFRAGNNLPAPVRKISFLQRWGRVAAAVLILLAGITAIALLMNRKEEHQQPALVQYPLDLPPGKNGAVLTLSDGSQLVLDSLNNGLIGTQNGAAVVLKNGELAYQPAEQTSVTVTFNTMSTPKGRQFSLLLPDGTKVWLNAASSLRYPTIFADNERKVEISGEAYFEVAKDARKPFYVSIGGRAAIEVLGTSFNVNAYENEVAVNTTLIDGSIAVSALSGTLKPGGNRVVLQPAQLARITTRAGANTQPEKILVVDNVDTGKITAWKDGIFNFNGTRLEEVMRQLERWYDIKVVYEKEIPNIRFGGKMSRNLNLDELLKILEASEVRFRMEEGRRLVVLP
jgi:ferric-dicitrate binding protein FerR (iron transport regulator)